MGSPAGASRPERYRRPAGKPLVVHRTDTPTACRDVEATTGRGGGKRKGLISRNF
jgi:hypothetical protein